MKRSLLRGLCSASTSLLLALSAVLLAGSAPAYAGLINIDSQLNTIGRPIVVNLDAGTYRVLPIGVSGGGQYNALNPWGAGEPNGWYHVYSISSPSINNNWYPSSFWENNRGVFRNYQSDIAALANAPVEFFTLNANEDVSFYIADGTYTDNAGGISLDVAATAVPDAGSSLLLARHWRWPA